ncbi:MAG: DUF1848 family protein [Armatimonadota bacterium]|nr:DUF1848 family protein [Armatimonadota bacterium]MDR5704227.1 DUF1848 family protein [Armatimonadota bacterium]
MKQVISISRRTDIPRFYLEWLREALQRGEVTYVHPGAGPRTVSLLPEHVHTLVFWSKDYGLFLRDGVLHEALKRYSVYFHFSITGMGGSFLEPLVPPADVALEQMKALARTWGPERIEWRFDPILHWEIDGRVFSNAEQFQKLAPAVRKIGVGRCTFSFATLYRKVHPRSRRFGFRYVDPNDEQKTEILKEMVATASSLGITLYSCADSRWTLVEGIRDARCIDANLLSQLHPKHEPAPGGKDPSQRKECLCTPSVDVGSYTQACSLGCMYCYANPKIPAQLVRRLGEEVGVAAGAL